MLAYSSTWIKALEISREAKCWLASRLISGEQYQALKAAHTTPLYTPNIFVRIGLAIFTAIGVGATAGFSSLILGPYGSTGISIWLGMVGIGCVVALEYRIREKSLYCAGIDDALLYSSIALLFGGIIILLYSVDSGHSSFIHAVIALPILVAATVRYADRLTAIAAYGCLLWIISYPMFEGGPLSQAMLPFVLMLVSGVAYVVSIRFIQRDELSNWRKPLMAVEIASLFSCYLASNYFVVREATENLLMMDIPEGGNIPYASLFYALTIGIPIAYVALGLKKRDSILLRVGLIVAALSALTFANYFSLGHPEWVLTIAGGALFAIAALAISYLKTERNGITHERLLVSQLESLNAESILVSQTLGTTPQEPVKDFKGGGGGGDFGGGGASEKW